MDARYTFTKRVDIASPRSAGDPDSPVLRENYFSRNMRLETVRGTERVADQLLTSKCTGAWRYYSEETGVQTPKTIAYTVDGKLWHIDEVNKTVHMIKEGLNTDAYPKAQIFKLGEQYYLYIVDGEYLWEWDGNASYLIYDRTPKQSDDTSYMPIDIIEHLDRIVLLTERQTLVSANLQPTVFNSADDSIEIIVGSGKGINRSLGKIGDRLYFFSTEGAFILNGDILSAVASTFTIDLADPNTRVNLGNSIEQVENGIVYLGVDNELYSFNGQSSELLSYNEQLKRIINPQDTFLKKCVGHYDRVDKRYFLSVVETAETENNYEIVYDAIENKIDFIRGRNVSCYCQYDGSREPNELLLGHSTKRTVLYANRGYTFDGAGIRHRLRTRDVYPGKGTRVRFTAFYPEFEPVGTKDITIRYLLDGKLSSSASTFEQNLQGVVNNLGFINISNQSQALDRVRPQINYAMGSSIAFEIDEAELNNHYALLGLGMDFTAKHKVKGKKIGQ